jgi:hypothetical protein
MNGFCVKDLSHSGAMACNLCLELAHSSLQSHQTRFIQHLPKKDQHMLLTAIPISWLPRQAEKRGKAAKSRPFYRAAEGTRRAGRCRARFLVRSLRVQRMNKTSDFVL